MADIQIPATIVANTGTGALMIPYRLAGDSAVYRESSPSGAASVLQYKRTEPKPTKDYAGASKAEAKYTRLYADTQGRLWPAVYTVSVSVPAFLTDTVKTAFVTESTLVSELATTRAALATQVIPQS